jgi:hypothetical protein
MIETSLGGLSIMAILGISSIAGSVLKNVKTATKEGDGDSAGESS